MLVGAFYDTPIPSLTKQFDELEAHIKKHPQAYPTTAGRLK
jgi:2-oxoisovalerate dehydrogenase E1 component alpha subunit